MLHSRNLKQFTNLVPLGTNKPVFASLVAKKHYLQKNKKFNFYHFEINSPSTLVSKRLFSTMNSAKSPINTDVQKLNILIHGHTFEAINAAILLAPYHKVSLTFDDIPFDEMPIMLIPPQIPFYYETRYKDVYDAYYEVMHPIREIRSRTFKNSALFDLDLEQLNKNGRIENGTEFSSIQQQAFFKSMKDLLRHKKLYLKERKIRSIRETEDGVYVKYSGASSGEEKYDFVIGADGINSKVRSLNWENESLPIDLKLFQEHSDYITLAIQLKNNDVEYADILFDLWHPQSQMQLFSTTNADGQPRIGIIARVKMPGGKARDFKLQSEISSVLAHVFGQTFNDNGTDIIQESLKRISASNKVPPDVFTGVMLAQPNRSYEKFVSKRVALIGSAAHVATPILGMQYLQNFYDAQSIATLLNQSIYESQTPDLTLYEKDSIKFFQNLQKQTNGLFKYFGTFSTIGYNFRMRFLGKGKIKSAYKNTFTNPI